MFLENSFLLMVTLWMNAIGTCSATIWDDSFDFVVVGGGTAGLTVANRLSENPDFSVLVVEYGAENNNPSLLVPGNFASVPYEYFINTTSVAQKHLDGKSYSVVVGGTLGGGSAVNRLYFGKGSKSDYDAWEELGNKGWGWEGLLPYFKKSTNFTPPSEAASKRWNFTWRDDAWGQDGPIHCTIPPFEWPTFPTVRDSFKEDETKAGVEPIPFPPEGHDGSGVGVIWVPNSQNIDTQTRSSALTAYYNPVRSRGNLRVITETRVTRIIFEDREAVGIAMIGRRDGITMHIKAKKEVILAAGPVFSANILHKSGVGPRAMLEESNVTVVYDLPGVGTNFQDTPTASLGFNFTKQVTLQGIWKALGTKGAVYEAAKQEYISNKSGPLILAQANSAAFLAPKHVSTMVAEIVANISSQDPLQHLPSIYDSTTRAGYLRQRQIILDRINRTDSAFFEIPINGRADPMLALLLKPLSRGTITLNHSDPELGPLVDYNALADPGDQLLIVSIVNFMRRLMKTPKLTRELGPTEVRHEPGADTYESILSGLMKERSLTPSCSHQSGACPMMPLELGGVVNDQLMVYGVERLSVVDSSIFPQLPAARLASTTFAVAEKAADLIKARHSRTGL